MKPTSTLLFALALSLSACTSDKSSPDAREPDSDQTAPNEPPPATLPPSIDSKPVPLLAWVEDLIERRTSDEALPDTVDDKTIEGTEDPAAFDKYLH